MGTLEPETGEPPEARGLACLAYAITSIVIAITNIVSGNVEGIDSS